MNTVYILHYEQVNGSKEYVVITEDNSSESIEDNLKIGYILYKVYQFTGDTGTLPLDRVLSVE